MLSASRLCVVRHNTRQFHRATLELASRLDLHPLAARRVTLFFRWAGSQPARKTSFQRKRERGCGLLTAKFARGCANNSKRAPFGKTDSPPRAKAPHVQSPRFSTKNNCHGARIHEQNAGKTPRVQRARCHASQLSMAVTGSVETQKTTSGAENGVERS